MFHLVCLGDSLTDCDHCFSQDFLGYGYVKILRDRFQKDGFEYTIRNYGTDGFTIPRLLRRIQNDTTITGILDPENKVSSNIITILIGINDVSLIESSCNSPLQKKKMLEKHKNYYHELLTILTKYTSRVILAEPFLFPCPAELANWMPTLESMSASIQELARQFQLPFIPLQKELNEEARRYGYPAITVDGVHLTTMGQDFLANVFYDCIINRKYV